MRATPLQRLLSFIFGWGAALLLFSTVFKEPLGGIARGYYRITGGWDKPVVERIGAAEAREADKANAVEVPH